MPPTDDDEDKRYQLFCLGEVEAAVYDIRKKSRPPDKLKDLGSPRDAIRRAEKRGPLPTEILSTAEKI